MSNMRWREWLSAISHLVVRQNTPHLGNGNVATLPRREDGIRKVPETVFRADVPFFLPQEFVELR